jgi:hypothetical protein
MEEVKLKPRSSHWFMRLLNKFGGGTNWTTLGDTIYYPDAIEDPHLFPEFIEHEKVHLQQYKKYGTFGFLFLYALVPLPFVFAYFRWRFEREAYLVQAKMYIAEKRGDAELFANEVSRTLWNYYFFTWPPSLMKGWLLKKLSEK